MMQDDEDRKRYIDNMQALIQGYSPPGSSISSFEDESTRTREDFTTSTRPPKIVVHYLKETNPVVTNSQSNNLVVVAVDAMDRPGVLLDISKTIVRIGLNCQKTEAAVIGKRSLSIWRCKVLEHGISNVNEISKLLKETMSTSTGMSQQGEDRNHASTTKMVPLIRYSRYRSEFHEISALGRGGFGAVFKCKNVLDGREYAVKKVLIRSRLDSKGQLPLEYSRKLDRVLREVKILALLDHVNIVRYYTAWLELENETERHYDDDDDDDDDDAVKGRSRRYQCEDNTLGDPSLLQIDDGNLGITRSSSCHSHHHQSWSEATSTTNNSNLDSTRIENDHEAPTINFQDNAFLGSPKACHENKNHNVTIYQSHILYIQMQLCQKTLLDYFQSRQDDIVDIPFILRMFCQIARGVQNVHEQGLIHRDLKPSNCFIDSSNVVKVGDFGLSRECGVHPSDADVVEVEITTTTDGVDIGKGQENTVGVGTSSYASPEQIKGSDYDSSSDVYSLGIILFELCYPMHTGMERCAVFDGLRQKVPVFPGPWHSSMARKLPTIHSLLVSMLSHDPKQRPTASEVASCVEALLSEYTVQSLGGSFQSSEGVRILRVEAEDKNQSVLERTIQIIQDASQKVHIHEYGLRSKGSKTIMEFAITLLSDYNGDPNDAKNVINEAVEDISCKLKSIGEIKVVRLING